MAAAVYQKVFKTKICYNQTCLFTLYPCFQSDFISIVTFWLSRKSTARVSRLPYLNHKICELCLLPLLLSIYSFYLLPPSGALRFHGYTFFLLSSQDFRGIGNQSHSADFQFLRNAAGSCSRFYPRCLLYVCSLLPRF